MASEITVSHSLFKDTSVQANLPVVIAIHGGSFQTGSGADLGPDFILNQADVVMVCMREVRRRIFLDVNVWGCSQLGDNKLSARRSGIYVFKYNRISGKYGLKGSIVGNQMDQREY